MSTTPHLSCFLQCNQHKSYIVIVQNPVVGPLDGVIGPGIGTIYIDVSALSTDEKQRQHNKVSKLLGELEP